MNRSEFAFVKTTNKSRILEIGPSYQPVYAKKNGWNVEIVDHLPKSELVKKLAGLDVDAIEEVDYVCTGNYSDSIPRRKYYDVIMGAHVIEHMLDFIAFFEDCDKLLSPDGVIKLIVPDCRYEFDCFREVTSLRSVIDNYFWRREKPARAHTIGALAEYQMLAAVIPEYGTYLPDSACILDNRIELQIDKSLCQSPESSIMKKYDANEYVDLHNWTFTPKSFELLIYELNALGLLSFTVDWIQKDPDSIEFYTILKRGKVNIINQTYLLKSLIEHKKESLECMQDYIKRYMLQENREFLTGFYVDTGDGYSENTKIQVVTKLLREGFFNIETHLPLNTLKVRWDPIEGKKLLLSDLEVKINDEQTIIKETNGFSSNPSKYLYFDTYDPQLVFDIPNSDEPTSIVLQGRITFI